MTRIAIIVGSLRQGSLNRQLAEHIAASLSRHAEVSWLAYADLPLMGQDLEQRAASAVARVREEVAAADGLWFVCPEYNGSYPGHVKNLIDWLGRQADLAGTPGTALQGKKVTVSGAGGRWATRRMQAELLDLLHAVGADTLADPTVGITLDPVAYQTDALVLSEGDIATLDEQVDAFYVFVAGIADGPNVHDTTSVPAEPSEGGVFATGAEVGSCDAQGCSVH